MDWDLSSLAFFLFLVCFFITIRLRRIEKRQEEEVQRLKETLATLILLNKICDTFNPNGFNKHNPKKDDGNNEYK